MATPITVSTRRMPAIQAREFEVGSFFFLVPVISNGIRYDLHHDDLIFDVRLEHVSVPGRFTWACRVWNALTSVGAFETAAIRRGFFFSGLLRPKLWHDFKGWFGQFTCSPKCLCTREKISIL